MRPITTSTTAACPECGYVHPMPTTGAGSEMACIRCELIFNAGDPTPAEIALRAASIPRESRRKIAPRGEPYIRPMTDGGNLRRFATTVSGGSLTIRPV